MTHDSPKSCCTDMLRSPFIDYCRRRKRTPTYRLGSQGNGHANTNAEVPLREQESTALDHTDSSTTMREKTTKSIEKKTKRKRRTKNAPLRLPQAERVRPFAISIRALTTKSGNSAYPSRRRSHQSGHCTRSLSGNGNFYQNFLRL